jgi:hypothetical protein
MSDAIMTDYKFFDPDTVQRNPNVLAEDYDTLLSLYRETIKILRTERQQRDKELSIQPKDM